MNRQEAERVFALVAEISGDLRGRIIAERWWLVWIAVGIDMLIASAVLQGLLWQGERRVLVLEIFLAINVTIIFILIRFIHRRAGGQRTATEAYLWWIWSSDILGTFGVAVFEWLAGWPLFTAAPLYALFTAFAFSMMAMVTNLYFLLFTILFVGIMVGMSLYPDYQFLIYGCAWFAVLVGLGLYYRFNYTPRPTKRL